MKKKFDEKGFKNFIGTFIGSINKETLETPIFKHFFNNLEYFNNPSEFYPMFLFPINHALELVLKTKFNLSGEVCSIYLNYDFLEHNLSHLCSNFYGSACSVDKARFIINSYIQWKNTKVMPTFNWKQKYTFHYPESGTMKEWLTFVEKLLRLSYGMYEEYLLALQKLTKSYEKWKKEKVKK